MTKQYPRILGALLVACACSSSSTPAVPGDGHVPDDALAGPTPDAMPFTNGVSTLAGAAEAGKVDGDRAAARFSNPVNVLIGPGATLYVADFDNNAVRVVDAAGNVSTLISQTGFQRPFGLALSRTGILYVQTDNDANGAHSLTSGTLWRIDLVARRAVVVAAGLGRPRGLAVLADGRIAMADYMHHVVSVIDPVTGSAAVLAGRLDAPGYVDAVGATARFTQPYAVAVRADGKLVVSDFGNNCLRLIDPATGATSTLAGSTTPGFADGSLTQAAFNHPQGVAIDAAGAIYVTDTGNFRVRRMRGTTVDTVAGNGVGGYLDADDPLASEIYGLEGISVSADGAALYVADGSRGDPVPYNRVRVVALTH